MALLIVGAVASGAAASPPALELGPEAPGPRPFGGGSEPVLALSASATHVAVLRAGGLISAYDHAGAEQWSTRLPSGGQRGRFPDSLPRLALDATRVAVTRGTGGFAVLSLKDGRVLADVPGPHGFTHDLALRPGGGVVTVHGRAALLAGHAHVHHDGPYSLACWSDDGVKRIALPAGAFRHGVRAVAAGDDGTIDVAAGDGLLLRYDAALRVIRKVRLPRGEVPVRLAAQRDGGLLIASGLHVWRWDGLGASVEPVLGGAESVEATVALGAGWWAWHDTQARDLKVGDVTTGATRVASVAEVTALGLAPGGTLFIGGGARVSAWRAGEALPLHLVKLVGWAGEDVLARDGAAPGDARVTRGGAVVARLSGIVHDVAVSASGRYVAVGAVGDAYGQRAGRIEGSAASPSDARFVAQVGGLDTDGRACADVVAGREAFAAFTDQALWYIGGDGAVTEWSPPGQPEVAALGSDDRLAVALRGGRILIAGAGIPRAGEWREVTIPEDARALVRAAGLVVASHGTDLSAFDVETGARRWRHRLWPGPVAISEDGGRVAVSLPQDELALLDGQTGVELGRVAVPSGVSSLSFRPRSVAGAGVLAVLGGDGVVRMITTR